MNYANRIIKNVNYQAIQTVFHFIHGCRYITQPLPLAAWKSHSTLPLLATQNYPFWLKYD